MVRKKTRGTRDKIGKKRPINTVVSRVKSTWGNLQHQAARWKNCAKSDQRMRENSYSEGAFSHPGPAKELLKQFELSADHIVEMVKGI